MDVKWFMDSLDYREPPGGLSDLLSALWWDKKGHWDQAHLLAQENPSDQGSRLHAYLHRVEGDHWNAGFWYQRAGVPYPSNLSLDQEWKDLLTEFIN